MFDSRETVWISVSIAILVAILLIIRFDAVERLTSSPEDVDTSVVTPRVGQTMEDAIIEAIAEGSSLQGQLKELIVIDVIEGEGAAAMKGNTITVHYAGNTQEGIQFDNSYTRGAPYTFTLGAGTVIDGWEEGLIGMKVGGKRALIVPARLAYGSRQVGPIPPNTPLVFMIELIEVR